MNSQRNILHLIETSEPGGAETVLANIAHNLDDTRYRSLIVVLEEGWLTQHLQTLGVEYLVLENKLSYDPIFLWKLTDLARRREIDLLHAHEFMMTVYGSLAARLLGRPFVGTIHGKVYYPEKRRRIWMLRFAVGLSSTIVAVSEDLNQFLHDLLEFKDHDKIVTLYNGIALDRYRPTGSRAEIRAGLGLSDEQLVLGTVGSLFEVKGLNYLLESVALMKKHDPGMVLLIAGEGNQKESLMSQSNDLGIADSVRFLGFRDDIPDVLQAIDVYACSSLSEGHSLSILEAMAMGKPIVATEIGGNPELVVDGSNGLLIPPKNPECIADAVLKLSESKSLRTEMGERSRRLVEEQFSLARMVSDYQNLYERLIRE